MKRQSSTLLLFVGFVGLALVPTRLVAQITYAAIHGTVTDSTGAAIPNASVTVTNTSTGIVTKRPADRSGYYVFPQLQVGGPYTVTVTASGFKSFAQQGLNLNVNDNRDVDAKMQVGAEATSVDVSATAVQVETSNTQLQQVATAEQLESIPLEGRDPAGLQKLEPGVVESSDRFGSFSSNGNQTPQNSYLVNGIDINDPALQSEGIQVNPDALGEENIVTSTMNPEFARNSGATVNQILKSGTNALHGSGFEFYRDTFLNNGNYFSQTRPQFHQNLYGGTLGGPIFKDKLFFFLAYQGLRQRSGATTLQQTLTTDQFAGNFAGDQNYYNSFAPDTAGLTNNPLPFAINTSTGTCAPPMTWSQCFPAGGPIDVPTANWSPIARHLVTSFVPAANQVIGNVSYYNFNAANTNAQDQGIIRLDYTPTSRDSIWFATIFQSTPSTSALTFGGGSFPGFGSTEGNHYKLFSASWTHTIGSNLLNELRAAYYRNPFGAVYPSQVVAPNSYGFQINPQDPISGLPFISVGNYFNLGFSYEGPQPRLDTNLSYADNLSWILGNHALKFGGSFEQMRVRNPFDYLNNGNYSFAGGTGQGGAYTSGDPLLDFALGVPDSYEQTNNGFINAVAGEIYGYAQDNWRVSPTFTLNYGLGWDVEIPNQNHQDNGLGILCFANSSQESVVFPGAPPGLTFPGDPGCNLAGGVPTRYRHFAPRAGFAWSPSDGPRMLIGTPGAHAFSLRAAFGLYYNRDQEEQSLQNLLDPPNFFTTRGATDFGGSPGFANPFADVAGKGSEPNPFPYTKPQAGAVINWASNYSYLDIASFDKSYNVPYTYNFNLNVQRALTSHLLLQMGYVGSVSHHLATWTEGDPITAAGHSACLANATCAANINAVHLLFPQYTADPVLTPAGNPWYLSDGNQLTGGDSSYNSFQASLIQDAYHGLAFTMAYTYSHALDDGSGYESVTGAHNRTYNYVPGFQSLNYGSSDFDARHRLVASYVYSLPAVGFMRSNLIAREGLSGWGVSGVTAFQSGFPIGINESAVRSGWCDAYSYFGCGDVPTTTTFNFPALNPRSASHAWFSTAPFSNEPLGTFGNTPRNFFRGPGFDYTNLAITKNIPLNTATRYIQLRLEAFNAFNHANFASPNGTYGSQVFGVITSVKQSADPNGDPSPGRSVQLAGKFYF